MHYLFLVAITATFTWMAIQLVLKFFPRLGLMDRPHLYGHERKPVPYSAGLVFTVVFTIVALLFLYIDTKLTALLISIWILTIVSFMDDRLKISPLIRLLLQILLSVVIFFAGVQVVSVTQPITGGSLLLNNLPVHLSVAGHMFDFSLLALAMTTAWVVVFMNTINWLDGVPGMVSGISTISFIVICILSILLSLRTNVSITEIQDAELIAKIAAIGASMTGIFFLFDLPTPKLLMGDTGTMVLGLLISALAIFSGSKMATVFLVLGFPIVDAVFVVLYRLWQKKSPLQGDFNHFHHRLLRMGFSERKTVLIICAICAFFGLSALFAQSLGKVFIILFLILVGMGLELWSVWQEKK